MTFFPLSNILGVFLARLAKVKVIISTRRDYGLWLNKWSIPLLKLVNRYVTRIIANSFSVKEVTCRGEKCNPSIVDVIYNGINLNSKLLFQTDCTELKEKYGIPLNHLVVGTVAGLRPMKKHSTIIRAAKSVLDARDDVSFVIVGDGILRSDLEALVSDLGIQKNVTFVGSQDNVLPFVSLFDIAVNSSANEGLSNAIMEYMALGKPCIAANAGGNPELIKHEVNGYIFDLDNHGELARQILSLLGDKEKQLLFSSESKKRIQELSMDKMIDNYDHLFSTLVNKQPQQSCD
jgi:glycosyltransferase involved in cell wall biosynthesis